MARLIHAIAVLVVFAPIAYAIYSSFQAFASTLSGF